MQHWSPCGRLLHCSQALVADCRAAARQAALPQPSPAQLSAEGAGRLPLQCTLQSIQCCKSGCPRRDGGAPLAIKCNQAAQLLMQAARQLHRAGHGCLHTKRLQG